MWKPDAEYDGPIRVIVIENGEPSTSRLKRLLAKDRTLDIAYANEWHQVRTALTGGVYDVAVIHGGIGEDTAFGVNERLKDLAETPPATIMYGGQNSTQLMRRAFRLGFSDVISADDPLDDGLFRSIAYASSVFRSARQKRSQIERLERLAQRDALTGLPNRCFLEERLGQLRALSNRCEVSYQLVLLRIAEAGEVAARFGFHAAERIVYDCGAALRATARNSDDFGRLDFDTFFYLLDNAIGTPDLDALVDRLAGAMAVSVQTDELSVTVSARTAMASFPSGELAPDAFIAGLRGGLRFRPSAEGEAPSRVMASQADPQVQAKMAPVDADGAIDRNSNRRAEHRRRVFKRGAIVLNNGFSTVSCTIRDVSEGGARIVADGQFVAPDRFELLFVESGQRFVAQKRWQAQNQIGLQFVA